MSLAAGRNVLGRYLLVRELPGGDDLWRWEARDVGTEQTVEIVAPRLHAALRPGASARHAAALRLPDDPAVLAPLASGLEGSVPVAARPAARGLFPAGQRLDPGQARDLLAWLAPAVQAAHAALGEGLRAEDLVVDTDGVVRLAPCGVVEAVTIGRPGLHRSPETPTGAVASPAGALYGLGVLVFRAVTGVDPVRASSEPELRARQANPLSAAAARPDLPEDLARLLDELVSPDPQRRLAAAAGLPAPAPVRLELADVPTTRPSVAAPARPPQTRPSAAQDVALAPWVITVAPSALSLGQRRRAAALADVPTAALVMPQSRDEWVPVDGADTERAALQRARSLEASGLPTQVVPTTWPMGRLTLASVLFAAGAIALAFALVLLPALLVAIPALLIGLALAVSTAQSILRGGRARAGRRSAAAAAERIRASGPLGALAGRLSEVRRLVLSAELPEPLRVDLLGALDEVEDRTDALGGLQGPTPSELAALDRIVSEIDEVARTPVGDAAPQDVERLAADVSRARAAWTSKA